MRKNRHEMVRSGDPRCDSSDAPPRVPSVIGVAFANCWSRRRTGDEGVLSAPAARESLCHDRRHAERNMHPGSGFWQRD